MMRKNRTIEWKNIDFLLVCGSFEPVASKTTAWS